MKRDMKSLIWLGNFAAFAGVLALAGPAASFAQAAAPVEPPASSVPSVPTTKILAIGNFTARATPKLWMLILPLEVRATVHLYLDGKIDQWYIKQDHSGVVFVMNLTDPQEALAVLDKLPLGQAGLMAFQLIPLGPISPLRLLLSGPAR